MPSPARLTSCLLTLICTACARVPADVSIPDATARASEEQPSRQAEAKPVPGECDGAELKSCADACHDRDCLEWCAGASCVATLASLWSCMDEAEQRFEQQHPAPQLEYETVTEGDEQYQQPTEASLELQYDYEEAYMAAIDGRWGDTCSASCNTALPNDADAGFCADWRDSYHAWERLTRPKPEHAGILAGYGSMGMLGSLALGSSMWLTGALAEGHDDHSAALQQMVRRAGWKLANAEACVPDLDDRGREFTIAVELGPKAEVEGLQVVDGSRSDGECVAEQVAMALALPVRVAREFPRLEVRVQVKPMPSPFGSGLGDSGLGGLGEIDWGDNDGFGGLAPVGDEYDDVGGGGGGGIGTIGGWGSRGGGSAADIGDADEND